MCTFAPQCPPPPYVMAPQARSRAPTGSPCTAAKQLSHRRGRRACMGGGLVSWGRCWALETYARRTPLALEGVDPKYQRVQAGGGAAAGCRATIGDPYARPRSLEAWRGRAGHGRGPRHPFPPWQNLGPATPRGAPRTWRCSHASRARGGGSAAVEGLGASPRRVWGRWCVRRRRGWVGGVAGVSGAKTAKCRRWWVDTREFTRTPK